MNGRKRWRRRAASVVLTFVGICSVIHLHLFGQLWNQSQSEDSLRMSVVRRSVEGTRSYRGVVRGNWTLVSSRPDTKHEWNWGSLTGRCQQKRYDLDGLRASVVITYHRQEALQNIFHTVHSLVERTPAYLLDEIVLVDDTSQHDSQGQIIKNYMLSIFPEVSFTFLRMPHNVGLIKARLAGFRAANGPIVVAMDSHMEVQEYWLEPLLHEIKRDQRTLAASYLDWMFPPDTKSQVWRYSHGGSSWKTLFDWGMVFGFQDVPTEMKKGLDPTDAVRTPVISGTIFAIKKEFFGEIGEMDAEMEGWGGENIDVAIRVWLFGGRVVNVPCSHAAHLEQAGSRDYRWSWKRRALRNYRRIAEVWFGPYKRYFFQHYPEAEDIDPGDLTERQEFAKRSIHDIKWYLAHVFPELGLPEVDSLGYGGVMNVGTKLCLHVADDGTLRAFTCGIKPDAQGIYWSHQGHLRFPIYMIDLKLVTDYVLVRQEYLPYHNGTSGATWIHWKNGPLRERKTGLCLEANRNFSLRMTKCIPSNPSQQWIFQNYTATYNAVLSGQNNNIPHPFFKEILYSKQRGIT